MIYKPQERDMIVACYQYTHPGTRRYNEDASALLCLGPEQYCAVLCDGLGGHGGGKDAADLAVDSLTQWQPGEALPSREALMQWMTQANGAILARRPDANQMKTTAVALYIQADTARWGHIGDSRLYHFHNGDLADFTEDHSIAQLAIKLGELPSRRDIPDFAGRSKLFRVLGDEEIKPELSDAVPLAPGEHAFLLCSDGLWERLREDEILLDLHKASTPEEWVFLLRARAQMRKSTDVDNNTAIAIWIKR